MGIIFQTIYFIENNAGSYVINDFELSSTLKYHMEKKKFLILKDNLQIGDINLMNNSLMFFCTFFFSFMFKIKCQT